MVPGNRGSRRTRQEGGSGGSSSAHDDMPANTQDYTYDQSLAGSSPYVPQPQAPGQTQFTHSLDPTLSSYNQNGPSYHDPQSGLQHPNPWSGGFDPEQTFGGNQVLLTQNSPDTARYYPSPSPQPTSGDVSAASQSRPSVRNSHLHLIMPHPAMSSVGYQQHNDQYTDDARPPFMSFHSPTPRLPTDHASLPSPPRTSSSHSHSGTGLVQPGQPSWMTHQWPTAPSISSRTVSNPLSAVQPPIDMNLQFQAFPSISTPPNSTGQGSNSSSYSQPFSYPGMTPIPQNGGPSFPEAHPYVQPAQTKRKRTESPVDPQLNRQKRRKVTQPNGPPVASTSRVTVDTALQAPSRATRSRKAAPRAKRTEVQTEAQKKDADRNRANRSELNAWYASVDTLLIEGPQPARARLEILDAVIERLGGGRVSDDDRPCDTTGRQYPDKSRKNSIRANNQGKRFRRIRELLEGLGYNVNGKTSQVDILRIVAYMLELENGAINQQLVDVIQKFLPQNQPPGPPGP